MNKGILMVLAVLMAFFTVPSSQAALIELTGLPLELQPNEEGSFEFGVSLTDMGVLSNIDAFNIGLSITGASGLEMPFDVVEGPGRSNYIFNGNSFGYTKVNPGGDLSQLGIMDVTANGIGDDLQGGNFLGWITLSYPKLDPSTILTFSLIPGPNFVVSDANSGSIQEDMFLSGRTTILVTPIPGAIWLLGGGILALFNLRRLRPGR